MTNAQRLVLRASEIRQRLNEISGLEGDDFTDEVRAESDTLQNEYRDAETRRRAAIVAEGESATEPDKEPGKEVDAEARERAKLEDKAEVRRYVQNAIDGGRIDGGAAGELD